MSVDPAARRPPTQHLVGAPLAGDAAEALLGGLSRPQAVEDALALLGRDTRSVGRSQLRTLLGAVVRRVAYDALERHRDHGRALAAALSAADAYDDAAWLRATQRLVARTLSRWLAVDPVDAGALAAMADDACRTAFVDALAAGLGAATASTADAGPACWRALLRESLDQNQHEIPVLDAISPTGLAHWIDGVQRLRPPGGTTG